MSLMLKEIAEQPDVLRRTIGAERAKISKISSFLKGRDIDLIMLVARGSSDNACIFGRYLLEIVTGIPVSLAAPSVFTLYNAKLKLNRALVVGVSQSGEGSDINHALAEAKAAGAFTLGITNEAESSMAGIVDETLLIHAGRERSVAATKTYTGQMLHFYMLAEALGANSIAYDEIPGLTEQSLSLDLQIERMVERYTFMDQCVVVGRGMNYGNSYELALKLMETCYVVAERFSSADFFHGPLAIVERRFPVILFGPDDRSRSGNLDLLDRLNSLGADCLAITNDGEIASRSTHSLRLKGKIDEFLTPIPFIVPGQLFAAHLSAAKGLDPDAPRSLAKVTKTL